MYCPIGQITANLQLMPVYNEYQLENLRNFEDGI